MASLRLVPLLSRRLPKSSPFTQTFSHTPRICHMTTISSSSSLLQNKLDSCLLNTKSQGKRSASSGWYLKVRRSLGLPEKLRYPKYRLQKSAFCMYMCCTEVPDYIELINDFQLDDTYLSWFLVAELHAWLMLSRLSQGQQEGAFVRQAFVKAFWADVKKRTSKVDGSMIKQDEIHDLVFHFNAALFSYDEGLLSNDKVLASALWRNLFESKHIDPQNLALAVKYVRKQVKHLDGQTDDELLYNGLVSFLPLHSDKQETTRVKTLWKKICETNITIPK
ncbi:ubiquinol-cytochrome-c reductase complex assembly factor 1-like [Argonauta hians]